MADLPEKVTRTISQFCKVLPRLTVEGVDGEGLCREGYERRAADTIRAARQCGLSALAHYLIERGQHTESLVRSLTELQGGTGVEGLTITAEEVLRCIAADDTVSEAIVEAVRDELTQSCGCALRS